MSMQSDRAKVVENVVMGIASIVGMFMLGALALGQSITIPNTFVNGTTADATQVNANFTALANNALNRNAGTMLGALTAQAITPAADNTYAAGTASFRWSNVATVTLNGNAPGVPDLVCGRLTLTTLTPVTIADVTAATSVFYTPGAGDGSKACDQITLYDGSAAWHTRTFTELTITVPSTTNTMYDVFIYDNSGTPASETLAWTNDTTRATALVRQNGRWVKSGATTRRYVGSIRTTGVSGQTEDSCAKRYTWNYYNRVRRDLCRQESTATWTASGTVFRQTNGAAGNQVEVVVGVAEVKASLRAGLVANNSVTNNVSFATSIGYDSTSASATGTLVFANFLAAANASVFVPTVAFLEHAPAVGKHFYAWLERTSTAANTTFFGDHTATSGGQTGLSGWIEG